MSTGAYRLPLALPRIVRVEERSALGGVAAGIGRGVGVDPTLVRLTFAFLCFADGAGLVGYAGAWLALAPEHGPAPSTSRRVLGLLALTLAGLLAFRGLGLPDSIVWPAAIAVVAASLIRSPRRTRAVAGFILLAFAIVLFVDRNAGRAGGDAALESSAIAIALLLVLGPWALRLAVERDAERTARIRQEERAEFAARVHDSVLQTLALVQRESADPRRVATLARRQERELRAWLYPDPSVRDDGGLAAAIEAAATEIEELHGVPVELVRTGDAPLDSRVEALVLAAREAMANAAEHSGAAEISTFVDAGEDGVAVYVRDRGRGFDPDALPEGAHGVAQSIRGRMVRAGGTATISSSPAGTEVELRLGRRP